MTLLKTFWMVVLLFFALPAFAYQDRYVPELGMFMHVPARAQIQKEIVPGQTESMHVHWSEEHAKIHGFFVPTPIKEKDLQPWIEEFLQGMMLPGFLLAREKNKNFLSGKWIRIEQYDGKTPIPGWFRGKKIDKKGVWWMVIWASHEKGIAKEWSQSFESIRFEKTKTMKKQQ
jgi:hypothetical protein